MVGVVPDGFSVLRIKHLQGQAAKGFSKGRNTPHMASLRRYLVS
jgi:hypothetical protein